MSVQCTVAATRAARDVTTENERRDHGVERRPDGRATNDATRVDGVEYMYTVGTESYQGVLAVKSAWIGNRGNCGSVAVRSGIPPAVGGEKLYERF